jgi:hypothetical protein
MRGSSNAKGIYYYRDATHLDRSGECPQYTVHAEPIERQVVTWLQNTLSDSSLDEKQEMDEDAIHKLRSRFERVKELYVVGEMDKESYALEKEKYEQATAPLQENGSSAIITSIKEMRSKLSAWQRLTPIEKKRLLQVTTEAVFIQGSVLVGLQPTLSLFPFIQVGQKTRMMCNSGPDEYRNRGA